MTSGFLLVMMLHLVKDGDSRPTTLNFKETKIICSEIISVVQREEYKYVGMTAKHSKEYISSYTSIDDLQADIDKQCKRKGK